METKKASKTNWKHITVCAIILVIFVATVGIKINAENVKDDVIADTSSDVVPLKANDRIPLVNTENEVELAGPKEEVTVKYSPIDSYITTYKEELQFFSNCFGVKQDLIENSLRELYQNDEEIIGNNIGRLQDSEGNIKTFATPERGIVEYFYSYIEKNPKDVNNKRIAYTGGPEYVEKLIIYFSTRVYNNVDTNTALSIGASESGYYRVKYMLSVNNVFGGMSSHGLTKYKNIEYGVLSYIRILSNNYYGKGLKSIDSIGKKYCPVYDNSGNKIASPHWISLVKTAMKKYVNYDYDIEISDLNQNNASI